MNLEGGILGVRGERMNGRARIMNGRICIRRREGDMEGRKLQNECGKLQKQGIRKVQRERCKEKEKERVGWEEGGEDEVKGEDAGSGERVTAERTEIGRKGGRKRGKGKEKGG